MMIGRVTVTLLACFICAGARLASCAEAFDFGLSSGGARLDGVSVESTVKSAPTVVLVAGLHGEDSSSVAVRAAVAAYAQHGRRTVRLLAVPVANPDNAPLAFPPTGVAYRENPESNALWRWLGSQAPDLVLVAGEDTSGLAMALGANSVANMGRVPARHWDGAGDQLATLGRLPRSEAGLELQRRRSRSPRQLATELAAHYGRDFDQPLYIGAIALIARVRLGDLADVQRIVEPWVDGSKDSLARPSALVMAGHIVFTELARRTGDPRYVAAVRKVAELGFDASGQMREAMPYHGEFSDSVFMGTVILAQAGALTHEGKYFDMADRHLRFMELLDQRPDGLYRHQPASDAAWGRGNGFAALGLALTLSELPRDQAGYGHALQDYRKLMAALLPLQTRDGLWRNVVDHPGAYAEFSVTAMIGFAMQRGLENGWLRGSPYRRAVQRAWVAVNSRSAAAGTFIDVCESTARMTSLDQYLKRAAILGEDARGGAMAMLFATELMDTGTTPYKH